MIRSWLELISHEFSSRVEVLVLNYMTKPQQLFHMSRENVTQQQWLAFSYWQYHPPKLRHAYTRKMGRQLELLHCTVWSRMCRLGDRSMQYYDLSVLLSAHCGNAIVNDCNSEPMNERGARDILRRYHEFLSHFHCLSRLSTSSRSTLTKECTQPPSFLSSRDVLVSCLREFCRDMRPDYIKSIIAL